ncbi:glutathione S-transferase family protein [Bowmanella dokdonensis]|uniref:Glutathione S-transferase family protein n=1 Tax=Bowmanella dokdonensis TaxID=751969 RepID=A0A939DS00_9ALTE|nr:glutathione S-transferase family protein [Bowmanella dokdonensis]MBN7827603.1 glutathione S-transferase family protein [Bowmanella dokdonensis]
MADLTLVIGNKNYSSWSLRPWLLMKMHHIAFEEILIPLYQPDSKARLLEYSPAGLVPLLKHGDRVIWDSLAIMEYLAERFPSVHAWPVDEASRVMARCISAEMHSGFGALRSQMPMNCRRQLVEVKRTAELDKDINRVQQIWQDCLNLHNGPFLFGDFSIADAMYAPVVTRFNTYGVEAQSAQIKHYQDRILSLQPMRQWYEDARHEPHIIDSSEI